MALKPRPSSPSFELEIDPERQWWPKYTRSISEISIPSDGFVGVDLEYDRWTREPYMVSVANSNGLVASMSYDKLKHALKELYAEPKARWIGHNVLSADCDVLHEWAKVARIPAGGVIDTLLAYYAMNQHLCHGNVDKDEETGELDWKRGPGRLRLGSMLSQYIHWAEYKTCRGEIGCEGPCPDHNASWYNALDAYGPILAWQEMLAEAKEFTTVQWPNGVPLQRNHDHLVTLQHCLNDMSKRGIPVDEPFVRAFELKLLKDQENIFPFHDEPQYGKRGQRLKRDLRVFESGFAPGSAKQVKDWAKLYKVNLPIYNPDGLKEALRKLESQTSYSATYSYVKGTLERLIEYKKLGRGVKNWFDPKYLTAGELHPEWTAYGGSMGRPVSKTPNVQNIPKRGNLAEVRKAFVAPKGLKWLKADACQGEFRMFGYIGGVDPMDMGDDAFSWLVDNTDRLFHEVARETPVAYLQKPRNGAKQMTHAFDYGEGLQLRTEKALSSNRVQRERSEGVLEVFEDWIYQDRYCVAFDGANLATRMFGSASWTNRRKTLAAQMKLLQTFPAIRRAQEKIMAQAQHGYTVTPSGHLLKLYGDNRDNIKKALAMNGQCTLSVYLQEALIDYSYRSFSPLMYIHDELGFLVPEEWTDKQCWQYVADMSHKSKLIPGFQCPIDASTGVSYGELEEIK